MRFLGTTLSSLLLAVIAGFGWGEPGAAAMMAGGAILCHGHVREHGRRPRADEQCAGRRGSRKRGSRIAMGASPDRLDIVESRPDGFVHGGLRAVHLGDRGEMRARQKTIDSFAKSF